MLQALQNPCDLIENKTSFAGPHSELSIYDTFAVADRVGLHSPELLYCGMLSGKKVLHCRSTYRAAFLPNESFVLAPGERVEIDFPEATLNSPTTCLTVAISEQRIQEVCAKLNGEAPLIGTLGEWHYRSERLFHTSHGRHVQALLERLLGLYTQDEYERNTLIDLGVSELLVRLLSHQTRDFLLHHCANDPESNGLYAAIHHLQQHFTEPLDVAELARVACMSRTRFFHQFKTHMACTPLNYQHQLRLDRARTQLQRGLSVTQVCFEVGYMELSHFSRRFKMRYGVSPRDFQQKNAPKAH